MTAVMARAVKPRMAGERYQPLSALPGSSVLAMP